MVKIRYQTIVTGFLLRFIVCFAILGGLYLLLFYHKPTSHNKPLTAIQKIAAIRSDLDQTYFTVNQISTFKLENAAGAYAFGNIISQYIGDLNTLQHSLNSAPKTLPTSIKSKIDNILSQELAAKSIYSSANGIIGQAVSFDPATDLPAFTSSSSPQLETQLQAAISGLTQVISNSTTISSSNSLSVESDNGDDIVSSLSKSSLQAEVNCFTSVLNSVKSNNLAGAQTAESNCNSEYPPMRLELIQNEIADSFSPILSYLKNSVPPVLNQLDDLTRIKN